MRKTSRRKAGALLASAVIAGTALAIGQGQAGAADIPQCRAPEGSYCLQVMNFSDNYSTQISSYTLAGWCQSDPNGTYPGKEAYYSAGVGIVPNKDAAISLIKSMRLFANPDCTAPSLTKSRVLGGLIGPTKDRYFRVILS